MKANTPGKPISMRWFRFLRFFLIPISFLLQLVQLLALRLLHYSTPEAWVATNTVDLVYTLISLVLTVLTFLWLRKGNWKGVQVYLAALALSVVYALVSTILYMIALDENWFVSAVKLVAGIVMLILNVIYFKKRKDQFAPFKVFDPLPVQEEAIASAEDDDVIREEDMYIEDYDEEYFKELCAKMADGSDETETSSNET